MRTRRVSPSSPPRRPYGGPTLDLRDQHRPDHRVGVTGPCRVLRRLATRDQPGTTIVTFLMVFLIQNTQNRDGAAIQAKLDELIRASAAQNRFIGIET